MGARKYAPGVTTRLHRFVLAGWRSQNGHFYSMFSLLCIYVTIQHKSYGYRRQDERIDLIEMTPCTTTMVEFYYTRFIWCFRCVQIVPEWIADKEARANGREWYAAVFESDFDLTVSESDDIVLHLDVSSILEPDA